LSFLGRGGYAKRRARSETQRSAEGWGARVHKKGDGGVGLSREGWVCPRPWKLHAGPIPPVSASLPPTGRRGGHGTPGGGGEVRTDPLVKVG